MPKPRGFTLIELLVTISIIAILSTIGITIYTQVTMKARDARRKLDLQNIAQALEVYYQKNGTYPASSWVFSSADWTIPGLSPAYISSLPQDPKNNGGDPRVSGNFSYAYCSDACLSISCTSGQWYVLVAQMENPGDSDRNEVKNYKWCDGSSLSGWSAYSYVITPK